MTKGIVLAGGLGTRLLPLTKVANKALLPVYDKPMVYYPIQLLVDSGIDDVLIVCGGNNPGKFLEILGNGEAFGLKMLHYVYQEFPAGIAQALGLAEAWSNKDPVVVVLADNVFQNNVKKYVEEFENDCLGSPQKRGGAKIFLTKVQHPEFYGCAVLTTDGKLVEIQEKPKNPQSNLIVTGLYMYDSEVWDIVKTLTPSGRGELEITDVNNYYITKNKMKAHVLDGYWMDCGEDLDGLHEAGVTVKKHKNEK